MAALMQFCSRQLPCKNVRTFLLRNAAAGKVLRRQGAVSTALALPSPATSPGSLIIRNQTGSDLRRSFTTSRALWNDEIREIATPSFPESVSEGDLKWRKKVGDSVQTDETMAEIETDKTAIPVNAPASGVIVEILKLDGAVKKGDVLCKLKVGAVAAAAPPADKPAEAATPAPPAPRKAEASVASSAGSIPSRPPPVPPPPSKPIASQPVQGTKVTPIASKDTQLTTGARTETRQKMSRMRLKIAQRLKEAQNTCAMLTTFNEIDMSNATDLRQKYKDVFLKKHKVKLGFMSAFIKASAYALQDSPAVNAVIDGQETVYRDYVDISVAVATPKGLVVPVIRNVHKLNYAEIEKVINQLGEKARDGQLPLEDMEGGTFTISNGGVFGSMFGTPIINPPQSAILGMHGIFDRPVAINGKVEIRPMMYVALTYDHRLIDGREAVTFLRKIKAAVEDPRIMLLDL